ncbi:hypothetical protein MTR_0958s0010, partial [Medicago truncatula]
SGYDIKELDNLNRLRGKLCISGLENIIDPADTAEKSLAKSFMEIIQQLFRSGSLEVLEFEWMLCWEEWYCLEGFPLLKNLSIRYCRILKRALPRHLPSLQILDISECCKLEVSIPKADNIRELD